MHWAAHGNTAAEIVSKSKYMNDWSKRLDDFLIMTGNNILENADQISHINALDKAHTEYEKYKEQIQNDLSEVEKDFIKQIDSTAKKLKEKK